MKPGQGQGSRLVSRVMCSGLAGSILILAAAALPASGDTWDFEADFSITTNQDVNGVWSYRYKTTQTRDGNYTLMPNPWEGTVGNGIAWYVDKGDSSGNLASGSFTDGGDSGTVTVENVVVAAGDRINFVLDPKANHGWDTTRVHAVLTYVPRGAVFLFR